MKRDTVPVLTLLNQEDHQERDDGGPGVDNKLPAIGVVKYRPGHDPLDYCKYGQTKRGR